MLTFDELKDIVDINIEISNEKNKNKLFSLMINTAMKIANCDAGTLYLYKNDTLVFKVMKTLSQGVSKGELGEKIDLPPVPMKEGNVCAYTAIHRELVNIPDVYDSDRFDFTGPKKYDSMTGYHTQSMLVIPMEDATGELVGVLQLLNAMDSEGKVVPFTEDQEYVIRALGSQAAVSVTNMLYIEEIKEQLYSFVMAFATAVDERTPYNGSHTRKVAVYAGILADELTKEFSEGNFREGFDENRREQLVLAAYLHDIGKMIVPLSVMNKATRLDAHISEVKERFKLLKVLYDRDYYKGVISKEENEKMQAYLDDSLNFICEIDGAGFLPDEKLARVEELSKKCYVYDDGTTLPFITEYETTCLSVRKGTLTAEERTQMESHVVMTKKILDKVHFGSRYKNVKKFASTHHELLDGSGYPDHIGGDELELESRMLAVVDVFDALTCTDRPYKKPMPREKAFSILHSMAEEGKLEDVLVCSLEKALEGVTTEDIEKIEAEGFRPND